MKIIAHRGANKEALENSREAFTKAIDAGAQRIELDVHLSRDLEFVVIHDNDLARTTDTKAFVSELSLPELKVVKLNNGENLPLLVEILRDFYSNIELNIEIKGLNPQSAHILNELIKPLPDYEERIVVSSFEPLHIRSLLELNPRLRCAMLWASDEWRWPHISHFSPLVLLQMTGAKIFHPDAAHLSHRLMEQCLYRGLEVYPYTAMNGEDEDREGLWATLKAMGVHGLCTNYPRELKQWLDYCEDEAHTLRLLSQG